MNKINKVVILKFVLIILMIATLLFIYVQSMIPPEESKAESDKVGEIVGEIIPPETPVGGYVQINIRKIAHFVEFAVLGFEAAIYFMLFSKKVTRGVTLYPIALILAFFDESIQLLSGRGPTIGDVWIDLLGFASSSLVVIGVWALVLYIIKKAKCKV